MEKPSILPNKQRQLCLLLLLLESLGPVFGSNLLLSETQFCDSFHVLDNPWILVSRHIFINISDHFVPTSLSEHCTPLFNLSPPSPLAVNLAEDTTLYNCHEQAFVANPSRLAHLYLFAGESRDKSSLLAQHLEDQ